MQKEKVNIKKNHRFREQDFSLPTASKHFGKHILKPLTRDMNTTDITTKQHFIAKQKNFNLNIKKNHRFKEQDFSPSNSKQAFW